VIFYFYPVPSVSHGVQSSLHWRNTHLCGTGPDLSSRLVPSSVFQEETKFINQLDKNRFEIKRAPVYSTIRVVLIVSTTVGFVPNMKVPGMFYVNEHLQKLMFDELQFHCEARGVGGFLPAVKQIANVASLPGIVKVILRQTLATV